MIDDFAETATIVANAEALFIGAGAGMGVDSGLPDFRGNEGFWRAYPPLKKQGLSFVDMANPSWFDRDPELAWGFYGHRLRLYRGTLPHRGFAILKRWATNCVHGAFIFTSNVDGQFQRADFDRENIFECHGSIHYLQCSRPCAETIWPADPYNPTVDETCFRVQPPLPRCPNCNAVARPNILMFGDGAWAAQRSDEQESRLHQWLSRLKTKRLVVIECGAGTAVPTVRWTCERIASQTDSPLIRINPRESSGPAGTIEIAAGALSALTQIDSALATRH